MAETVRIAALSEIPVGSSHEVTAAGRVIALFNVDGTLYALDGVCPHAGGPLGQGQLDGCVVTCPWHGAQFDLETGNVVRAPAQDGVGSYKVLVEGDDIKIENP